jgi:hypothetical protein
VVKTRRRPGSTKIKQQNKLFSLIEKQNQKIKTRSTLVATTVSCVVQFCPCFLSIRLGWVEGRAGINDLWEEFPWGPGFSIDLQGCQTVVLPRPLRRPAFTVSVAMEKSVITGGKACSRSGLHWSCVERDHLYQLFKAILSCFRAHDSFHMLEPLTCKYLLHCHCMIAAVQIAVSI